MITRYHTLSCPTCQRQKMVAIPSQTQFACCHSFDVTVDLVREGMLTNVKVTWERSREELPSCVWRDAETPFADNH